MHEAYLRLAGAGVAYQNRTHFFSIAARLMRQVLVDLARTRSANKRGGDFTRVTLDEGLIMGRGDLEELIEIDRALSKLAAIDARKSEAVELIYFGGLSYEEAAETMQISEATLDRELRFAKAWLHRALTSASP